MIPAGRSRLVDVLLALGRSVRDRVVAAVEGQSIAALSRRVREDDADTIYAIDAVAEECLLEGLAEHAAVEPLRLVVEGLDPDRSVLPQGCSDADVRWRVVIDPIDGTRGLMYQKRPAWFLAAAAPESSTGATHSDLQLAVQVEIPLAKQHLSDEFTCIRGLGVRARRVDRIRRTADDLVVRPSSATGIEDGFASVARFFPGGRSVLAAIDDEICERLLGPPARGRARCFEDQYLSSGGQLHELFSGRDRFIADLRPLLAARPELGARGITAHPYDLCTALIAEELGVRVVSPNGRPLTHPLDLTHPVAWVGYANDALRAAIEPALQQALRDHGLTA